MRQRILYAGSAVCVAAIAIVALVLFGVVESPQTAQAQNVDCYMQIGGAKFICDNGGEIELQTGATLDIQSGATFDLAGDLDQSDGDIVVADYLRTTAQSAVTVVGLSTITPTGTYQPLTAAGNVATGLVEAGTAGDIVYLINTHASNTITISDTGTLKLSGDTTLGENDVLILWSDGTNWIEVGQVDN